MANNPFSEKEIFRKNYARFCNVLKYEDDLLPFLVEKNIISWDNLDEIKSKSAAEKGPTLLRHISSPLEIDQTHGFYGLLDTMINYGKMDTQEFARKIKYECLSSSNATGSIQDGIEYIKSMVGDQFTEQDMVEALQCSDIDAKAAFDYLLKKDLKENEVHKDELLYTLYDLTRLTESKIQEIENRVLDIDKDKDMINGVQLLLMVVNSSEYYAAMYYFSKNEAKILNNNGTTYYIGKWGETPAALVRQKDSGYSGTGRSNHLARLSINLFCNLKFIVALGVCGTIEQLGHVVVSTKICGCNDLKITNKIINRSEITEPGDCIFNYLKNNYELWSFTCTKPDCNQYKSKALFKPILSGTPLIASGEYRDKLIRGVREEAVGVEMEGIGVLQALQELKKRDSIEFIIVKAGCDYANEEKNKEWQPVAAMAAADFLHVQLTNPSVYIQLPIDKKERKIPKENLRYTLDDLILQTKDFLEECDNNKLDKHSYKTIINGVRLLLMVVHSSEFYAAMNYFSRSEAKKLESDGDIYYVGKWGKISAALVQQSRPGIAGSDGAQQLTIASINLFKNLEVIIALGVCGTMGRLGDVIVSSQIDGCDNIKIVGNNIQIINRGIKANPGRTIYRHLKQNHEIWSFICTTQETEMHKAKAVIKPMLSGVHLVASAEYREKLKKSVHLEAEGLEMEGIGVIHGIESAKKKGKIEFVIVKAGCDYADEYKSKEWQPVAAMAAADFVYYQLSKPNWLSDDESTVKLDQEILQVIKDAKEKDLAIKVRHSKVLFCGSSKVGKTNFINLLLKKDFEESHKPTGVAESHQLLAKHCQLQVTLAKGCTLQYMDYKTQIEWLRWFLSTKKFYSRQNTVSGHSENDSQPGSDSSINNQSQQTSTVEDQLPSKVDTPPDNFPEVLPLNNQSNNQSQQTSTVENQLASKNDTPPDDFPEVWDMLTFLDTGGQPAFINMLPALNSSAMITFILHSMEGGVDSLTKKVTVYGDGPKEYSLDYNYIDLVKMLFSMRKPKELQMFEQLLVENDGKSDKNCYLSLVGTKSDLCEDSDTVAKNVHNELKPIIDQTIHKSSLIPIGEHYFVPVSNCKANTEDEDPVAAKFRSCIFKYLEKRDMLYIPIVWLMLELEIINKTKEDDVIHFDEIFNICKENNLITNKAEVRTALQFFHHVGIFLYYGSDDPDMKKIADIVITNYQWIFKNLAAMVKAAKSDNAATEDFRCNGFLNKNVIDNNIDWELGKDVGVEYFLKLLERLSIISPIKTTQTSVEYFMPCVLPTFSFDTSSEQNFLAKHGIKGKADPLLMQLVYEKSDVKSYYNDQSYLLPRGVFCCLINQLLLNHPRFKVQLSDGDSDPCVFNNLIVLHDENEKCFVALIDKFMYLKVEVLLRQHTTIGESSYHDIKLVIGSTLKSVCDKFRLDISRICIGFLYSDDKLFWAQENYDEIPKNDTIYNRNNNPKELEESQKIWFLDQCSTATTDVLSTTLSSAADTIITVPPTSTSTAEANDQLIANMKLLYKLVVPKISAYWDVVLANLEYDLSFKQELDRKYRGNPRECCIALLEDWISSNRGVSPKTFTKLLEILCTINEIAPFMRDIIDGFKKEGITIGKPVIFQVVAQNFQGVTQPNQYSQAVAQPNLYSQGFTQPNQYSQGVTQPNQYSQGVTQPNQYSQAVAQPNQYSQAVAQPNLYSQGFTQPNQYSQGVTQPNQYSQGVIQPNQYSQGFTRPNQYSQPIQYSQGVTQPNQYSQSIAQPNQYSQEPSQYSQGPSQYSQGPSQYSQGFTQPNQYLQAVAQPNQYSQGFTQPNQYSQDFTQYSQTVAQPNQYIEVPRLQSTGRAPFTSANTTSSAPIQQGTNHTVNSSTKDEGLISHEELKNSVDKISIVDTDDSTIQNTIQILLVTANDTEYGAALTFLNPMEGSTTLLKYHHVNNRINKHAIYIFGKFGYFNAAVHLMTKQGPAAAQDVVTVAADCFGNNLNAIFAVGVACGVEGKSKMLDVLVSKTISSYAAARIGTNGDDEYKIENRSPINMPVSSFLQTYFDQLPKWPGEKSIAAKLLNKPTQVSGNILSGNYLIDNTKFKQKLLKAFAYNAIGIEMEGAGLFQDYPDTQYKIMVIKAVCDFGDGKKDKTYQPTAAMLAVECLKHCIGSSPYLPQKLAEFCGNKGVPLVQSTVGAPSVGANISSSASMPKGTNHTVTSSTKGKTQPQSEGSPTSATQAES